MFHGLWRELRDLIVFIPNTCFCCLPWCLNKIQPFELQFLTSKAYEIYSPCVSTLYFLILLGVISCQSWLAVSGAPPVGAEGPIGARFLLCQGLGSGPHSKAVVGNQTYLAFNYMSNQVIRALIEFFLIFLLPWLRTFNSYSLLDFIGHSPCLLSWIKPPVKTRLTWHNVV